MPRKRVFVEMVGAEVCAVYCCLDCAETRKGPGAPGCVPRYMPYGSKPSSPITRYAIALLCCDECGFNLMDQAAEAGS